MKVILLVEYGCTGGDVATGRDQWQLSLQEDEKNMVDLRYLVGET